MLNFLKIKLKIFLINEWAHHVIKQKLVTFALNHSWARWPPLAGGKWHGHRAKRGALHNGRDNSPASVEMPESRDKSAHAPPFSNPEHIFLPPHLIKPVPYGECMQYQVNALLQWCIHGARYPVAVIPTCFYHKNLCKTMRITSCKTEMVN